MKEINFFENSQDNLHCLQACIKSVLSFYFPDKVFSDKEIDRHTIHNGGWSWLPPSVVWLQEIGLDVVLFSQFDYKRFAEQGEGFYKEFKGELAYQHEVQNGSVKNLKEIQKASQQVEGTPKSRHLF